MATRSFIGKLNPDQTVSTIYCHWDGYPSHNGKILLHNYETEDKVNALLARGDLSVLSETVDKCIFYDERSDSSKAKNIEEFFRSGKGVWAEYYYLFDNGYWKCWDYDAEPIDMVEEFKEGA